MIRGEFDVSDPYPRPWIRVFAYLAGISATWTEVRFLLDTGAGMTCLHPRDAIAADCYSVQAVPRCAPGAAHGHAGDR